MTDLTQFDHQDVEIQSKEVVFQGFFRMTKYRFRHKLFEGGWSEVIQREILERGHAVAVLPYDPVLGEFVLLQQFRFGAMATKENPWLAEIVAGIIEPNEEAEDVCRRESEEEAGLELLALRKALTYLSSPGGTSERLHIYLARVDASQAGGIFGLPTEGEDIRAMRVPEETAIKWLEEGKIDNAASVIALQWFQIHKQQVLEEWSSD